MKKNHILIILGALMAAFLVACSSGSADYGSPSEMIVIPEDNILPDAASTVEKLINNEDIIELPDSVILAEDDDNAEESANIKIYYVFGSYDGFMVKHETLENGLNAEELIRSMTRRNLLPIDVKLLNMSEVEEEDGSMALVLDLSNNFKQYLDTMSAEAEEAILSSITNTFLWNYKADKLYIVVEGDVLQTNNATYSDAFVWCTTPLAN